MDDRDDYMQLLGFLPDRIVKEIKQLQADTRAPVCDLEEIRLRRGQPVQLILKGAELFLDRAVVDRECLTITFQKISGYSAYSLREEIHEGFITLPGGHRAGLCGRVRTDGDGYRQIPDISSINLRIAHVITGCCRPFFSQLTEKGHFLDTLIVSPPGWGKTTYLRDIILHISTGYREFQGRNISVADERGEISGQSGNQTAISLGRRADVMTGCPKDEAMLLLLRTMGPAVIAADEIGSADDIEALKMVRNSGSSLLMTAHGRNLEDLLRRPVLGPYLQREPFDRYVFLEKTAGGERRVYVQDGKGAPL